MQLQEIYQKAIKLGIKNDPRTPTKIEQCLQNEKKKFEKLENKEREFFDKERLENPYADSRIVFGDPKTEVKKIAVGIDLDATELLLVNELNHDGAKIDAAFSHHPKGIALARLADVMKIQEEMYEEIGVSPNVIEKLMDKEITRVNHSIHPSNHQKNVDIARLLKIPYVCIHTIADNLVFRFMQKLMAEKKPHTVGDVMNILLEEPEYAISAKRGVPPIAFVGSKESKAGKVTVTGFTGGTSGSSDVYESMKHAGVGTEIAMHMKPEAQKAAEKNHINVVIAGHIASDSLGMNLLFDELQKEKDGIAEIVELGGFTRFSRN